VLSCPGSLLIAQLFSLRSWLFTCPKLCKWGAGKILVATSDRHGKVTSEMLSEIEGHLVEVMTSGLFSY
jgi:hypothetical protein